MSVARRIAAWVPDGSVAAVAARLANPLLAFAATLLVARLLGPMAFGAYTLAATAIGFLLLAAALGLDSLTPRALAVQLQQGDDAGARRFLRWTTRAVVLASLACAAAAAILLAWNPMRWSGPALGATLVILAGLPFAALLRLGRSRLQALGRTATGLAFEMPVWTGLLLAGAGVLWLVPQWRTAPAMAGVHAAALAVAWAGSALAFRLAARPRHAAPSTPGRMPDHAGQGRRWLADGLHLGAFAVLMFLLVGGDLFVVGTMQPAAATGHYGVAARAAALSVLVLQPVQMVVAPRLARAWAAGDRARVERLAGDCLRVSLLAGALVSAALWLLGRPLLALFGPGFAEALWALRWLSLAQVVVSAIGPLGIVLRMVHQERAAVAVLAGALVAAVPLTVAGTTLAGITGAAVARLVAALLVGVGFEVALSRRTGLRIRPWGHRPAPQAT